MKRIITLVLSLIMLVSVFAGCGSKSDGKTKKLVWAIEWSYQKDYDEVLKVVNEKLAKIMPGVEIEFLFDPSFTSKWNLWMAGKKQIDLSTSGWPIHLDENILDNSFQPLDDLVNKYAPTIKKEQKTYKQAYDEASMDGKLYAVPNIQYNVDTSAFIDIPEKYYSLMDVDRLMKLSEQETTATNEMYQVLDDYLNKVSSEIKSSGDISLTVNVDYFFNHFVKRGYEFVGGTESPFCYKVFADDVKIVNFYETDEFKLFTSWAKKWYDAGFIPKDAVSGEVVTSKKTAFFVNSTGMGPNSNWIGQVKEDGTRVTLKNAKKENGSYRVLLNPSSQDYLGIVDVGKQCTYLSIPNTAKYPKEAMQLIELLRQDEATDLLNAIIYGIEGKHYEKTGERTVKAFDYAIQGNSGSAYGIPYWMVSSSIADNKYVIEPYTVEEVEYAKRYYEEIEPNLHKTKVYGLSLSRTDVKDKLSQISAVVDEFKRQLISGVSSNPEDIRKQLIDKMDKAGSKEVIKNFQKQVDDYIKYNPNKEFTYSFRLIVKTKMA